MLLNVVSFYNQCNIFADIFLNEVIDKYMHCVMQYLKKNAHICIYFRADLNVV